MAGTSFVSADARFGIRTIDFEWIAHELRSRVTVGNETALSAVLEAHDEQGIDMLLADKLDANDFHLFARAFDAVTRGFAYDPWRVRNADVLEVGSSSDPQRFAVLGGGAGGALIDRFWASVSAFAESATSRQRYDRFDRCEAGAGHKQSVTMVCFRDARRSEVKARYERISEDHQTGPT